MNDYTYWYERGIEAAMGGEEVEQPKGLTPDQLAAWSDGVQAAQEEAYCCPEEERAVGGGEPRSTMREGH